MTGAALIESALIRFGKKKNRTEDTSRVFLSWVAMTRLTYRSTIYVGSNVGECDPLLGSFRIVIKLIFSKRVV